MGLVLKFTKRLGIVCLRITFCFHTGELHDVLSGRKLVFRGTRWGRATSRVRHTPPKTAVFI